MADEMKIFVSKVNIIGGGASILGTPEELEHGAAVVFDPDQPNRFSSVAQNVIGGVLVAGLGVAVGLLLHSGLLGLAAGAVTAFLWRLSTDSKPERL